jgi:polyphosphate kinase
MPLKNGKKVTVQIELQARFDEVSYFLCRADANGRDYFNLRNKGLKVHK